MSAKYYKVLNGLESCHGGEYTWTPGETTPYTVPNPCYSGWHFTTKKNLYIWAEAGKSVYEVTIPKGAKVLNEDEKKVASQLTLGKKVGTLTKNNVREINRQMLSIYVSYCRGHKAKYSVVDKCIKILLSKKSYDSKWKALWSITEQMCEGLEYVAARSFRSYVECMNEYQLWHPEDLPQTYNSTLSKIILDVISK